MQQRLVQRGERVMTQADVPTAGEPAPTVAGEPEPQGESDGEREQPVATTPKEDEIISRRLARLIEEART
jgi:hypothetical protein